MVSVIVVFVWVISVPVGFMVMWSSVHVHWPDEAFNAKMDADLEDIRHSICSVAKHMSDIYNIHPPIFHADNSGEHGPGMRGVGTVSLEIITPRSRQRHLQYQSSQPFSTAGLADLPGRPALGAGTQSVQVRRSGVFGPSHSLKCIFSRSLHGISWIANNGSTIPELVFSSHQNNQFNNRLPTFVFDVVFIFPRQPDTHII